MDSLSCLLGLSLSYSNIKASKKYNKDNMPDRYRNPNMKQACKASQIIKIHKEYHKVAPILQKCLGNVLLIKACSFFREPFLNQSLILR